jgi:hypothetical protein
VFTPFKGGDHLAFFEIAATLIPILLFGGVVAERLRPNSGDPLIRVFNHAAFIPALGSLAILAEVTAILSVVAGTSSWWSRLLVATSLTAGMLAIVVSLWLPWIDTLRKRAPRKAQAVIKASVVVFGVSLLGSVGLMTFGVSAGEEGERTDAYLGALQRSNVAKTAALNRATSLVAASGRAQQQRIAAEARHDPPAVIAGYRRQEEQLFRLTIGSVEWYDHLELEGANLYREMLGLPKLRQLPRAESPSSRGDRGGTDK